MIGLTPVQAKALAFLRSYIAEHGYAPSFAEMMPAFGVKSKSNVHRTIQALRERGYITLWPSRSRSIAIIEQPRAPDGVDFLEQHLATWVRVTAARAGVTPLQVVAECVRDGWRTTTGRTENEGHESVPQGTSRAAA